MDGGRGEPASLSNSARTLVRSALGYARVRIELVEVELSLERERLEALIGRSLLLMLSVLLTVQFAAMLVLAMFWETQWRVHAIGGLVAISATCAGLCWREVVKLRRAAARPLAEALHDIEELAAPLRGEGP